MSQIKDKQTSNILAQSPQPVIEDHSEDIWVLNKFKMWFAQHHIEAGDPTEVINQRLKQSRLKVSKMIQALRIKEDDDNSTCLRQKRPMKKLTILLQ